MGSSGSANPESSPPRALEIWPDALEDIQRAALWYEAQCVGSGEAFVAAVRSSLVEIRRIPFAGRRLPGDIRRWLIRRYPYKLIYRISGEKLEVVSVYHTARGRQIWKSRLV